jgi:radical SAM superfamily enzyme YgiQ (UPF0313 family)
MLDLKRLTHMAKAGCWEIHPAMESGSDSILEEIKKAIRRDHVDRTVEAAQIAGVKIYYGFIVPHPGDSKATVAEIFRFIRGLASRGVGISLSTITPFPGSPLWRAHELHGVKILSKDWFDYDYCSLLSRPNT